ncbi:MAG: tRNA preQ1(34) S-adenosylmethionine ribosyltransferase-isomerase QueA, partial [Chloroflexi bacterium]|nr:tRNA preQ1(34) S-adenosylmethionine ribosyltransferase-isomerase QueA [Chloroflexota bacterium]
MNTSDFDYDLPPEFIAQTPLEPRDASRLMVLNRADGTMAHRAFRDIGEYLRPGDLLVFNESKVIPARLFGRKAMTGGKVELLLLARRAPLTWEALVGGSGVRLGTKIEIEGAANLTGVVLEELDGARRVIQFSEPVTPLLPSVGHTPLPPYIHEPLDYLDRYQTVYAKTPGSAAAPTAGLHFTPELLMQLREAGVEFAFVTLHIGLDTFAPVMEERVEDHKIHSERCELTPEVARRVNEAKLAGRRVIAIGTTSVRVLESAARASINLEARHGASLQDKCPWRPVVAFAGPTDLFITPGHRFRVVDAMITNFHLPHSTLLMLVSA